MSEIYNAFAKPNDVFNFRDLKSSMSLLDFRDQWLLGGYPEPTLQQDSDFWQMWMQQFRDSYINRDIAALFPNINKVITPQHSWGLDGCEQPKGLPV